MTQTPWKPHHVASQARLVIGWLIVVIAVALTALAGFAALDYATGEYIGTDAGVRMFILLTAGVLSLISWSVGLLLVLGDRIKRRSWIRVSLTVALVVAVVAAMVLLALAMG